MKAIVMVASLRLAAPLRAIGEDQHPSTSKANTYNIPAVRRAIDSSALIVDHLVMFDPVITLGTWPAYVIRSANDNLITGTV